jgi:hypothetical protein
MRTPEEWDVSHNPAFSYYAVRRGLAFPKSMDDDCFADCPE